MKLSHDHENEEVKHEMKEMMGKLEDLNCNNAANAEICHLVASFFVSILFTFWSAICFGYCTQLPRWVSYPKEIWFTF